MNHREILGPSKASGLPRGIQQRLGYWLRTASLSVTKLICILAIVGMTSAPNRGQVLSIQTITTGVGGFTPVLNPLEQFGYGTLPLGDPNADGRPDFLVGSQGRSSFRGSVFLISLEPTGAVFSATEFTASALGIPPSLGQNTLVGTSMANLGDLDGDGSIEVAISSSGADFPAQLNEGVLAIVSVSNSLSVTPLRLIGGNGYGGSGFASILSANDRFSRGVANVGDINGDGVTDLAVTSLDDDGGSDSGAVYILFLNTSAQVISHQKISNLTGGLVSGSFQPGSAAGLGPSGLGDLDGDAIPDMAVCAPVDSDGGIARGAIHILFLNSNGTVKSQSKISDTQGGLSAGLQDYDRMGFSSSRVPDLNGDGFPELAVSCSGRSNMGAAFILFLNSNGTVQTHVEIGPSTPGLAGLLDNADGAGLGVQVIDDLDGDGNVDMLFPAPGGDTAGNGAGELHVLFLDDLVPSVIYPGNDPRFTLSTGLNTLPCTTGVGEDAKTAAANDILRVCLDCDPGLYGSPVILACDLVVGGTPQAGGLISGFWLNLFSPNFIFLIGAPGSSPLTPAVTLPGGTSHAYLLPGALTGLDVVIQAALINPAQVPGGAAFSDAHVISMP